MSLALAAGYARVALFNLGNAVIGGDLDGYENLWNNYWVKTALFDLHRSPFYTDYIYYPTGVSLRFHTLNPFNGLLTLPFNLTIGYVPTTNLLFVFALFLTAVFAFLLIRDLVGNPWAAFAGAAVFTYANSNQVGFLSAGQTEKVSAEWLPLYFFFMYRALNGRPTSDTEPRSLTAKDTRSPGLYIALSILTLVIMSLTDWQYVMFAVFATLLYFVFVLFTRRSWNEKRTTFLQLAAIGAAYTVLVGPTMVIPMISESLANPWLAVSSQSRIHSLDLLALIGPGLENPGYLAIIVALLGLWAASKEGGRERETALFWALAAGAFYLVALGPELIINGRPTSVPMPYLLLQDLPVFSAGRDPRRFSIVATLGVAVLVAFGLRALFQWLYKSRAAGPDLQRYTKPISALVVAAFLAVTLEGFMAATGDAKADPPEWPDFYNQIGSDTDSYAILELPLFTEEGRGEDHYMMYQVVHHKRRFGGRWARDHKLANPDNFVKKASLFRDLWLLAYPQEWRDFFRPKMDFLSTRTDYETQGVPLLNFYDVRYIVLYKAAIGPQAWTLYGQALRHILGDGVKPYYDDKIITVYKVPLAIAPDNPLTLDVGSGWSASEVDRNGRVFRWADNSTKWPWAGYLSSPTSRLFAMNLRKQRVQAVLSFQAHSYKQPRSLNVDINGNVVASRQLKPDQLGSFHIDLTIPPGNNTLAFSSPEPALPTDNPAVDNRLLSFDVSDVALHAR